MRYMGGKSRIWKFIEPIILKDRGAEQWYVEPFVGGANGIDKVDGLRLAADNNKYLIAMWQGIQDDVFREFDQAKEHYALVRDEYNSGTNLNFTDFYIGYVGFMASANGRFFEGGYSGRTVTKSGHIRDYIDEAIRNVEKQTPKIKGIEFVCCDYLDLDIPIKSIVYCDIPYQDTKQYSTSRSFRHDVFWSWCRSLVAQGHKVFVSEYQAPSDFVCVWQREVKSSLRVNSTVTTSTKSTEKLFVHKSQLAKKSEDKSNMSFHYKYGGSTAKRTLNCQGWQALASTVKRTDKSNEHADRGTMLHTCCEILENEGIEYDELLERGVEYEGIKLTKDLLDEKVIPAMEALEDFISDNDLTTIITEELIEYSDIIGGTPDILAYNEKLIACADYKFGDGVMVYADDNDQMYFCVWAALDSDIFKLDLDPSTPVKFAIIQPSDKRSETLDVWETTVDKVDDFGERFLDAVDVAENSKPGENLHSGDWCTFCPGAGICPEKGRKARTALALIDNTKLKAKDTDMVIPVLDLSEALTLATELEPWIKDVRSFAYEQLEAGADVPDWKLVEKRATRKWKDPEGTAEYLKRKLTAKNAMKTEVISPAQAEKMAKTLGVKIRMKDRTVSKSSGTTLVPASDKREAIVTQKEISETLKQIENENEN